MAVKNPGYTIFNSSVSPVYLAGLRRKFENTNYQSPAYYDHLSRYKNIRLIKNEDDRLIHETMFNYSIVDDTNEQRYTVTSVTENRLDIISLRFYNTSQYWWIIALANDIIDPLEEIKKGTTLRIPSLMSLYNTDNIFG